MWDADELDRDLLRIGGGDYSPVAKWSDRFHAFANSVVSGTRDPASAPANGAVVTPEKSTRRR